MTGPEATVRLNTQTQHPNLYHWCLQEFGPDGSQAGPDFVPFIYGVNFVGRDFVVVDELDLDRTAEGDEEHQQTGKPSQAIRIRLAVESPYHAQRKLDPPKLSMFGSDLEIENISLLIASCGGDEKRTCSLWGGLAFRDADLGDVGDSLHFALKVSALEFSRFEAKLSRRWANEVRFVPKFVSGVYGHWNDVTKPSVLKFLSRSEQQIVRGEGQSEIVPQRLGKIGAAMLSINSVGDLRGA